MLAELQSWWENTSAESRTLYLDGAVVVGALVGGWLLGGIVARVLRSGKFDLLFHVSGPTPESLHDHRRFSPTTLVGLLVRLTVWAGAAWWLALGHDRPDIAGTLALIIGRTWTVVGIMSAALALAGVLARRVIECLEAAAPVGAAAAGRMGATPSRTVAGAVGAGAYGLVLLLTLLTVADYFNWTLTRNAAAALWQLTLNLLIAGAALLVGGVGARWAREVVTPPKEAPAQEHRGHNTALGIIAGTTALAVALLLFSAGLGVGLAAVAIVGVVLFVARGHLPDVIAGLKLRKKKVGTLCLDGTSWQVMGIGLLQSDIGRGGENFKVPNRRVLEAAVQGKPAAAAHPVLSH